MPAKEASVGLGKTIVNTGVSVRIDSELKDDEEEQI